MSLHDESSIERELFRLEYIRGRMIECYGQCMRSDLQSEDSAPMLQGRIRSWADQLGKVAEAIRGVEAERKVQP